MDNPNPIRYSDLITPDNSITDLIKQLTELIAKYDEMKNALQTDAAAMAKSMQGLSGATDEQRQEITRLAKETDNLSNKYRDISAKEAEASAKLKMANDANREAVKIAQLKMQMNKSEEGSYNRLSAQYRLLKIRINEMGEADKKAVEAKRALEVQARKLYEQMSNLQKATGKYTLEVGHYENALKALPGGIGSVISSFQTMRGQLTQLHGTELPAMQKGMSGALTVFTGVVGIVSILGRTMGSARNVVREFEQAEANLATVLGVSNDEMQGMADAARQLARDTQYSATGVVELQMALAKLGYGQSDIKAMQTSVAQFATAIGTDLAGASQVAGQTLRAFGIDASDADDALGTLAVLTNKTAINFDTLRSAFSRLAPVAKSYGFTISDTAALLGTLVNSGMDATMAAQALNKIFLTMADSNGKLAKALGGSVNTFDEVIDGLSRLKDEGVDLNAALELTDKRSAAAFATLVDGADKARTLHGALTDVSGVLEEIADQRLATTQGAIEQLNSAWDNLMLSFDNGNTMLGSLARAATDIINSITPKTELDKAGERVEKTFKKMKGDIDASAREIGDQINALRTRLDLMRAYEPEDTKGPLAWIFGKDFGKAEYYDLVKETEGQLNALVDAANKSFKKKIGEYSWSFTTAGATGSAVSTDGGTGTPEGTYTVVTKTDDKDTKTPQAWSLQNDKAFQKKRLALLKEFQAGEIATREEFDMQVAQLEIDTLRGRMERLKASSSERQKLEAETIEKEIALAEKREKADEKALKAEKDRREKARKDEQAALMAQLNKERETIQLEIDATKEGSQERERLRINLLYKQWEIEIAVNNAKSKEMRQDEALINAKYDKLIHDQRVKAGVETAEDTQQEATKEVKKAKKRGGGDIIDLIFGYGDEKSEERIEGIKNAIRTTIDSVMESVSSLISSWQAAGDAAVEAADKEVESAERMLESERKAAEEGYANNVRRAEKELALAKKNQQKALKEQQDAQKVQMALDSVTQASSLVTASAEIWKGFSGIPVVGPALAVASIALMFGSFIASRVRAAQVSKESYGEGHIEMLEGGSHASGHDISLGRKSNGVERRAEGGEFFAVINKRNSRRYRDVIPDVINSFNDGTFADKYQRANAALAGYAVQINGADLTHIERGVDAIRKQGEERMMMEGGYMVVRYKNLTRKIKS